MLELVDLANICMLCILGDLFTSFFVSLLKVETCLRPFFCCPQVEILNSLGSVIQSYVLRHFVAHTDCCETQE